MEVAGVVLGAAPIVLYALDNYKRALGPAKRFWRWEDTIQDIIDNVTLHQEHLNTTLRNMGLQNPNMAQIEAVLQVRRPDRCHYFISILRNMDGQMKELLDRLEVDLDGQPKWSNHNADTAGWEWRRVKRSFGARDRNNVFEKLHRWNVALQNCGLERREIGLDSEHSIVNLVRSRFNGQICAAIRLNALALHRALTFGLECACLHPHQGNLELNWHAPDSPAPSKSFSVAISGGKDSAIQAGHVTWKMLSVMMEETVSCDPSQTNAQSPTPPTPLPSQLPSPSPSTRTDPLANSMPAISKRRRMVQFLSLSGAESSKDLTPAFSSGKHAPIGHSEVAELVLTTAASCPIPQASSEPLPRSIPPVPLVELCTILKLGGHRTSADLCCIPVPNTSFRFQLRTAPSPTISATPIETINLDSLLLRKRSPITDREILLRRKQRFGIAAALTSAVLHLCDSNWMGKTIENDNIQLFLESRTGSPSLSRNPYLLCNFHSSSSGASQAQQTPKDNFQSKQIQNRTLFTLAVRLLELGLNKPFSKLRHEYSSFAVSNPGAEPPHADDSNVVGDFDIAKALIVELALDPGRTFADAVDRCLRFLFPGPEHLNNFSEPSFRKTFFDEVVAPIQATYEMTPDL
ncbi:hypothetical protein DPSP01_014590 [Paraphaeosphaeria sporulosa]